MAGHDLRTLKLKEMQSAVEIDAGVISPRHRFGRLGQEVHVE